VPTQIYAFIQKCKKMQSKQATTTDKTKKKTPQPMRVDTKKTTAPMATIMMIMMMI
jgi:hypothetical protein